VILAQTYVLLTRLPASGEEDPPASESACPRLTRWLTWPASDARAMRMSSLIATLNPTAETTNPARLIQSPTLIVTGSSALIIERGRATLTLFLCETPFCVTGDHLLSVRLRMHLSSRPHSPEFQAVVLRNASPFSFAPAAAEVPNRHRLGSDVVHHPVAADAQPRRSGGP
jgi:hypothetical protein